jgi:hypothetical protein
MAGHVVPNGRSSSFVAEARVKRASEQSCSQIHDERSGCSGAGERVFSVTASTKAKLMLFFGAEVTMKVGDQTFGVTRDPAEQQRFPSDAAVLRWIFGAATSDAACMHRRGSRLRPVAPSAIMVRHSNHGATCCRPCASRASTSIHEVPRLPADVAALPPTHAGTP